MEQAAMNLEIDNVWQNKKSVPEVHFSERENILNSQYICDFSRMCFKKCNKYSSLIKKKVIYVKWLTTLLSYWVKLLKIIL